MNSHGTLASPPIDSATRGNPSLHKVKVICWTVCQVTSLLSCCHRRGGVHFIIQAQPEFQLYAIYGLTFTKCVELFAARLKKRWGEDSEEKASRCWLSPHKDNFRANRKWNSLVFFTSRKEKLIHLILQFNFYIAFLTINQDHLCAPHKKWNKLQNRRSRDIRHEWKCVSPDFQIQTCLLFLTAQ